MTNVNSKLVIIGAGGHAKVCYDIAQLMGKWDEIVILDDALTNDYFHVSGPITDIDKYSVIADFFVAIGDNSLRGSIIKKLEYLNVSIITLIHPQSVIASDVSIGEGSVIMPGVVINNSTKIGKSCIINTSASIDHDNYLDDFVHVSPGVHLAGSIKILKSTWIGIGTIIKNGVTITSDAIIGAGSLVIENINKSGIHFGHPIKNKEVN